MIVVYLGGGSFKAECYDSNTGIWGTMHDGFIQGAYNEFPYGKRGHFTCLCATILHSYGNIVHPRIIGQSLMEFLCDPQSNHMAMTHTFECEKLQKIPLRPPNQAHGNDPHL